MPELQYRTQNKNFKGWLTPMRCDAARRVADTSEIRQGLRHGAARQTSAVSKWIGLFL